MKKALLATLFAGFLLGGITSCSDDKNEVSQKPPVIKPGETGPGIQQSEYKELNQKVHEYLGERYLWNAEYCQKIQNPDFNQSYQDFFYGSLMSLTENTLDKRPVGSGENGQVQYRLFSSISQLPSGVSKSRGVPQLKKESDYTFGITGLTPIAVGASAQDAVIYFCVQGVYPDSPAAKAGLKRGTMIYEINGARIHRATLEDSYYMLLAPGKAMSVRTTEEVIENGKVVGNKESSFSSKWMPSNPILCSGVTDRYAGHRIGYLNYASFDASFDVELFDVFKGFRRQQVTDLVLDLRYNGGGHVWSADLIATCVAGIAAQDKVFVKYRYNKQRMAELRKPFEEKKFSFDSYANLKSSLADGFLNLSRVYCLVGPQTASASELVINALRGIDLEVILIGKPTVGKNVGMESVDMAVGKHRYRVMPITFQSYNAKDFGDYQDGFEPDVLMDETNPYNEEGRFYLYRPFMAEDEPLYAKAIELITGARSVVGTRSVETCAWPAVVYSLPAPVRPGFDGMWKPFVENE